MEFLLQQILNGVMYGCTYALVGIGFNLVFGVMNTINLAHGETIMGGAFIALVLVVSLNMPLILAGLLAALACAAIGMLIERTCLRPVRNAHYMAPLLTTLGASIVLLEIFIKIFSTEEHLFPTQFEFAQVRIGDLTIRVPYLITLGVSVVLMIALHLWINRTRTGLALRALAENVDAARLMGINVNRLMSLTLGLASAIGCVAGVLVAVSSSLITPRIGSELLLKGFVVIILGGLGSITGAVAGGILLGVVEVVTVAYLPSLYRDYFSFGLLMLILLLRPAGLAGKQVAERA
jgi:branched-chain amino acid transport system permease protein